MMACYLVFFHSHHHHIFYFSNRFNTTTAKKRVDLKVMIENHLAWSKKFFVFICLYHHWLVYYMIHTHTEITHSMMMIRRWQKAKSFQFSKSNNNHRITTTTFHSLYIHESVFDSFRFLFFRFVLLYIAFKVFIFLNIFVYKGCFFLLLVVCVSVCVCMSVCVWSFVKLGNITSSKNDDDDDDHWCVREM